jgi:hypothetical protein
MGSSSAGGGRESPPGHRYRRAFSCVMLSTPTAAEWSSLCDRSGQGAGDGDLFSDHRHVPVSRIQLRLAAAREVTVIDLDHAYLGVGLTIDLADEHLH